MIPVVSIVLALAAVVAWFGAPKLHEFAYRRTPLTADEHRALAEPPWSAHVLDRGDDASLVGLIREPATERGPWILLLPGNARQLLQGFRGAMDALCEGTSAPPGVAFWAWRGFDGSTGIPTAAHCAADARAAWDYLTTDRGIPADRIHIVSYSLGTAPAVALATALEAEGTPPASLILLSPYTAIGVMGTEPLDRFRASHAYEALGSAAPVSCPVHVAHGAVDDVLPLEGARKMAEALGGREPVHVLENAGHADWLGDPKRWEAVRAWIQPANPR